MKFIGAHVSISGGVENAPLNAHTIGANAFALFTKNQRQWYSAPLKEESIVAFRSNCEKSGFKMEHILPHDSYLINLGHPESANRQKSLDAFIDEMHRADQLGLKLLNFHPGSFLRLISLDECLKNIAECVKIALKEVPNVKAVIENTAGQGSNVGYAFEHLARLIELIDCNERVGVCIDTCHAYAAGYDLKSEEGYAWAWAQFSQKIGYEFLSAMHLNDSKSVLAGHLDRHNSIGKGELGEETFHRLMQDSNLDNIPLILETIDETLWADEIRMLHSFED